ncbi:MAG TPA: zinc ribbon domain-containing protein [Thermomicrobiaceae bacterium]|nr:zinc ribbon domain-containing protein [Thermomicrobiaceae bacterium]
MPIYEYRCGDCRRKVSIYFRSMSAAGDPRCPRCGGPNLERLFSRVVVRRGGARDDTPGPAEMPEGGEGFDEGVAGGGYYDDDPYGMGMGPLAGMPDEDADPMELVRWTRQMSAQMGEPLDADLDRALTDIERGADPDEVLERLEESPPPEPSDFPDEG